MSHIKKELIFFTDFDLDTPNGAGYNRVLNYARALSNSEISLILLSSQYSYKHGFSSKNSINNLKLLKGNQRLNYKRTFEDFHFCRILKFIRESGNTLNSLHNNKTDRVFFLYNSTFATALLFLCYYRILKKQKIYIEKNELKIAIAINRPIGSNNVLEKFILQGVKIALLIPALLTDFMPIFYNGIIVISKNLFDLYCKVNKNIIRVPILATVAQGKLEVEQSKKTAFSIGYFGNIGEKKDGLFSLIEAVILTNLDNIALVVYGGGYKNDIKRLQKIVSRTSKIKFFGLIEADEVQSRLLEFDLLAFPRPKNLQTKYGFSTKLAEFLLSKTPVLTSDVSDNKHYLIDNENAFIIKAQKKMSIGLLANKIVSIYNLPKQELDQIGYNGFLTACSSFNPSIYSGNLENFFFH